MDQEYMSYGNGIVVVAGGYETCCGIRSLTLGVWGMVVSSTDVKMMINQMVISGTTSRHLDDSIHSLFVTRPDSCKASRWVCLSR